MGKTTSRYTSRMVRRGQVRAETFQAKMTRQEILRRYPHATESFISKNIAANTEWLPAMRKERPQGNALERTGKGKEASRPCLEIVFTIYARRPMDWDNWHTKCIQDCLVEAGLLHGDAWNELRGSCVSRKVHTTQEERTEIEVFEITK